MVEELTDKGTGPSKGPSLKVLELHHNNFQFEDTYDMNWGGAPLNDQNITKT